MEPKSPCRRPECIGKDKMDCAANCKALCAYQIFLTLTEDKYSPPGIDYADCTRIEIHSEDLKK